MSTMENDTSSWLNWWALSQWRAIQFAERLMPHAHAKPNPAKTHSSARTMVAALCCVRAPAENRASSRAKVGVRPKSRSSVHD